jgi:hypothetical protein
MGLGGRAEVGLDGLVAREGLVGFLIGDDSGDDDVVAPAGSRDLWNKRTEISAVPT